MNSSDLGRTQKTCIGQREQYTVPGDQNVAQSTLSQAHIFEVWYFMLKTHINFELCFILGMFFTKNILNVIYYNIMLLENMLYVSVLPESSSPGQVHYGFSKTEK